MPKVTAFYPKETVIKNVNFIVILTGLYRVFEAQLSLNESAKGYGLKKQRLRKKTVKKMRVLSLFWWVYTNFEAQLSPDEYVKYYGFVVPKKQ